MEIELPRKVSNKERKSNISCFINEIQERMNNMEDILVIDRFENDIAICENKKTGKIIHISKKDLPEDIKEGNIIKRENNSYVRDVEKENITKKRIEDKMNKLWKK